MNGAALDAAREAQWETLLERQRELEDNALALGGQRFRRRVAEAAASGKGSTVGAAKKLLQMAIDPLETAINELASAKRRGPKHAAIRWAKLVGADAAAYMTVKVVIDGVQTLRPNHSGRLQLRQAALDISQLILDELRYRRFQEEAPGLFHYRMSKFTTRSYAHMARSLNAAMKYANVDVADLDMPTSQRLQVGIKLIDMFEQTTGAVEIIYKRTGAKGGKGRPKDERYIVPTAKTLEWLGKRNDALEFLSPVAMPMVVPPLPWSSGNGGRGGYRFALRGKYDLVRRIDSAEHQSRINQAEMPIVFDALNRVQNTAWKINADVLELVQAIQRRGGAMAGVPAFEEELLPAKPFDIDTNEDARKAWRRAAGKTKDRNHLRAVRAMASAKVVSAALGVANEEAIFFPYSLDFRGRVYPISQHLSPQGDDLSRGLLTFADTKPVGSEGGKWLAIHGANCLGDTPEGAKVSKMTFAARVQWIDERSDDICRVAADPFTHQWWVDADKPLQFFAFCVEWSKYVASGRSESFVSGLPVAQDGSCNGLQHFSALLRDDVGGKAVNLLPGDAPEDVYQRIADKVLDKLEERSTAYSWHATQWLTSGLVNRKLTKRPTMTFGYGSKRFGFRSQIIEYLRGQENFQEIAKHFSDDDGMTLVSDAASLMSELIWESLNETVIAAAQGMAWMQKAAREIVAAKGKPVLWTVPATNFPVCQEYFVSNSKQIETILAGKVIQPRVYEKTDVVALHKQINAVAPNVVHSLDAAALMLTVTQAAANGVEAFGMVHDSYATVAGDAALLAQITRQCFVRLYNSHDVIGSLYQQFMAQMDDPAKCPPPPLAGNLDVSTVLVSDYFFA